MKNLSKVPDMAIFKLLWYPSSRVSCWAGSREHGSVPCQVCVIPLCFCWAVKSQAVPPGYASTMARRSEILDIQKDQSTNLAQTFFTSVRYKKKFTHHTEEESRRPGSRQDSVWEGESNCEQLPNSAEKARGSLRAFRPFPLSHRLKMTSVDSSQTQERAVWTC